MVARARRATSQPLSLKARAIGLLAQREHSAVELRRKLMRIARAQVQAQLQAQALAQDGVEEEQAADPAAEVTALLIWLQAQGYLDETRFVESRLHVRAARHGNLRIEQELAQHGLALGAEQKAALRDSELDRARTIWLRKFGSPGADAAARAKQMRFLAGRGFSPEVIRRLLREGSQGEG